MSKERREKRAKLVLLIKCDHGGEHSDGGACSHLLPSTALHHSSRDDVVELVRRHRRVVVAEVVVVYECKEMAS